MEERGTGTSTGDVRLPTPSDVRIIGKTRSYEVTLSAEERLLLIATTDYHPGVLCVGKEDLRRWLEELG